MIIQEEIKIGSNFFMHTYSDTGYKIERDGVRYTDAIDPQFLGREYIETDEPIGHEYEEEIEQNFENENLDNEALM